MAAMTQDVRELFETAENMVLCTASADGTPNGAAIGMKTVIDEETVYISDQFFKKTLANLKENQKVAVAFWTGHDAFQIHGTARYVNEGDEFAVMEQLERLTGIPAPKNLRGLRERPVRHTTVLDREEMLPFVLKKAQEKQWF